MFFRWRCGGICVLGFASCAGLARDEKQIPDPLRGLQMTTRDVRLREALGEELDAAAGNGAVAFGERSGG